MKTRDLSVIIMARNEEFLSRTVEGVLKARQANTDVIVIADGNWPDPAIADHPDVTLIMHNNSRGQRVTLNEAAKMSRAKYIMKLDAHCIVSDGFDKVLVESGDKLGSKTVQVPMMYNLHVFNWRCMKCGNMWYQGPTPKCCYKDKEGHVKNNKCDGTKFRRVMVWQPRKSRVSTNYRFDTDLKFQYWNALSRRPGFEGDITETMSLLGACFVWNRKRYLELGGSDEEHGKWGQQGTEIACMAWLSGGRLVTNKKCWFAHMFRTQGGDFGFPYKLSGAEQDHARRHSRKKWQEGKWKHQVRPLSWLIDHFSPVPGWPVTDSKKKGIIYYTDNQLKLKIAHKCKNQIKSIGLPIVSASLKPMNDMGKNVVVKLKRGYEAYFTQIYEALKASEAEIIFFCEHDWLYHPTHFEFTPPKKDVFYYNDNWWRVRATDGHAVRYDTHLMPTLCCYRKIALEHYKRALELLRQGKKPQRIGFEPGTHNREERPTKYKAESWQSKLPNVDIRHGGNLTASKWKQEDFRSQRNCKNWQEKDSIPFWGKVVFDIK